MCVRVQWESGISVSNSGREWKGYGWKGRGGWNITREKGINILSTSGGNSFFGGCPSLLTLTFFLLLNFPVSRLLHKARYPGLLEFGGGFFFLSSRKQKYPSTHFCSLVCLLLSISSVGPPPTNQQNDGWDGLCGFFLRPIHLPGDISDRFPTVPYYARRTVSCRDLQHRTRIQPTTIMAVHPRVSGQHTL